MKWPWVNRSTLDLVVLHSDRLIQELKMREEFATHRERALREQYDRLVERTITMQREGFSVVKPPVEEAPAKPFEDVIEQAIADRAHDSISDRRLRQYAAAALAVPKAVPEAIAARILAGETLDEEYAI